MKKIVPPLVQRAPCHGITGILVNPALAGKGCIPHPPSVSAPESTRTREHNSKADYHDVAGGALNWLKAIATRLKFQRCITNLSNSRTLYRYHSFPHSRTITDVVLLQWFRD